MNKTALITGASSGIGRALAHIHAQKQGNLVLVARSADKLEELKEELEEKYKIAVTLIVKDLSRQESAEEIYNQLKKRGIEIDYLINNAGFGGVGLFYERPFEESIRMINVNVQTLTSLTHLFLADFVRRNSGKILLISSIAALMPGPLQSVYFATKAYVSSFGNALVEELKTLPVTVTTLLPGPTETQFGRISGMDKTALFYRPATVERVAQTAYKAMLKGKRNTMTGVSFFQRILLNIIPFFPKKIVLALTYKLQKPR